jgi:DNA-binding NtrC family response regulator
MTLSPLSRRLHILLVEDDGMVRETVALMLEDEYEIHTAVSIRTALIHLRAADAGPLHAMLLDCLLPDGNLADVLAEADLRSIPVVLISGDLRLAENVDPHRRFLPKPFTRATLLGILDTARG